MPPADLLDRFRADGAVTFTLRVRPGARSTAWTEPLADGTPMLSLKAAAHEGEANHAMLRFLADEFSVPMANITVMVGLGSRIKRIRIIAVSPRA